MSNWSIASDSIYDIKSDRTRHRIVLKNRNVGAYFSEMETEELDTDDMILMLTNLIYKLRDYKENND